MLDLAAIRGKLGRVIGVSVRLGPIALALYAARVEDLSRAR